MRRFDRTLPHYVVDLRDGRAELFRDGASASQYAETHGRHHSRRADLMPADPQNGARLRVFPAEWLDGGNDAGVPFVALAPQTTAQAAPWSWQWVPVTAGETPATWWQDSDHIPEAHRPPFVTLHRTPRRW